jgi:hypothetical protein
MFDPFMRLTKDTGHSPMTKQSLSEVSIGRTPMVWSSEKCFCLGQAMNINPQYRLLRRAIR